MDPKVLGSIIRWLVTMVGAGGALSGDELAQLAGALASILALVWSVMEKKSREKE